MNPWRQLGPTIAIAGRDIRAVSASAFGVGLAAATAGISGAVLVVDLRAGEARLDQWFSALVVLVGLLAVVVATRNFAEEERRGSLELLLTAPVSRVSVAVGKVGGTVGIVVGAIAGTAGCPILVAMLGRPDPGPILTGYVGLLAAAAAFAALSCACAAATSNPLAGASIGAGVLLAMWGAGIVAAGGQGLIATALTELSPASHLTGFLRGTLAVADLVYFASLAAFGLSATVTVLAWRR